MKIPENFFQSVVALGSKEGGKTSWIATGFLLARKNSTGFSDVFLVTNKHVLEAPGVQNFVMRCNYSDKIEAKDYDLTLYDGNQNRQFTVHPDTDTDVACMYIPFALDLLEELNGFYVIRLQEDILFQKDMYDKNLLEGTKVFSLGFPEGIVGLHTKTALCRMGCISRMREMHNRDGFLLDIQNFGGGSGSPVVVETDEKEYKIIGLLAKATCETVMHTNPRTGDTIITQENTGIAVAYTTDAIKETIELEFERVRQRYGLNIS